LFVCLLAVSFAQLDPNDECLSNSVARKIAETISIDVTDTTNDEILAGLYEHLSSQTSRHAFKIYVGLDNGNFIGVWNCYTAGSLRSPNCNTAAQYVGVLVDEDRFGDLRTYAFVLDEDGSYDPESPIYESPNDFVVSDQPFYVKENGWEQEIAFSGTGYEFSFSVEFTGGVLAGIREPLEPCTACLTHSWPKAASILLSNQDMSLVYDVNTVAEVEAILKKLFDFAKTLPGYPQEMRNLYLGTADGGNYGIYNCEYPAYVDICAAAGSTVKYFANVKNTAVPGFSTDGRRDRFVVDENGKLGEPMEASTSVFDTVNRPWYLQQNGWTMPFTGATAGTATRGYCSPFNGGVIVSDVGAPCVEYDYTCPEPPEPEECDSSSALSSVAALLVAAIFLLVQ